jgi:DNA-directed RNA polymerase specialized sigma24 family protein
MPNLLKGTQLANTNKKAKKKSKPLQTDITYDDIEEIVEYLVKTKCRNYTFDCWTEEDIAQEIRIICLQKLVHFDPERAGAPEKWRNFFGRCVDNALKNLKRDNYLRAAPPCKDDCNLLHGEEAENSVEPGRICKRWLRFKKNLKRKIKVLHPVPIEIIGDTIRDISIENNVELKDLQEHLVSRTPEHLRVPLLKMINGKDKEVSRKEKQKIRDCINRILE